MTKQEQIHNWLTTGLRQPTGWFSEIFYYDKRENEFFSILITDYFLFDEDMNVAEETTTSYTDKNLATLADRITRIDNEDPTIIALPRLGDSSEESHAAFISQQEESFLNLNSIDIETATIWEVEEDVKIKIDLKNNPG